ncbi:cyclin-T2-like isoform X3 [Gouania willdenowi]|uniref:cyclin-T2-like isoform X3 n=1 Tax=Gouania willdenowi TaxID=441366 RepID=UPI001054E866|nr:cyclin-T2-like isoform X3 [Gouania willdenowi]
MAATRGPSSKWFFTREQLESTPSRRCGVEPDRELSYRQQAANLIQDMGQRLNVSQLTINTAIVYMHRFYMNHSFTKFHRNIISPTTLFLAAKVEEQPRKLEHVIKVAHACLNPQESPLDTKSNPTPHYLLPPVQAHGDRLRLHPPGLQMVQLGDPSLH